MYLPSTTRIHTASVDDSINVIRITLLTTAEETCHIFHLLFNLFPLLSPAEATLRLRRQTGIKHSDFGLLCLKENTDISVKIYSLSDKHDSAISSSVNGNLDHLVVFFHSICYLFLSLWWFHFHLQSEAVALLCERMGPRYVCITLDKPTVFLSVMYCVFP